MIIEFLKTSTSKGDLATALRVLRGFKECESQREWAITPFLAWAKLEQLEEFLSYLVDGGELKDDTKRVLGIVDNGSRPHNPTAKEAN
jgi:hypothetical protein